MLPDSAKVYSSDKKEVGRLTEVNDDYFVSLKPGLVMDEEHRIPIRAVECVMPDNNELMIEVSLSEEQLRHGYEIVEGRPNSDLVKGKTDTDFRMPTKKQVIRYNAIEYFEHHRPKRVRHTPPPPGVPYACDRCAAKFDSPRSLNRHRSLVHKGPVGI